MKIQIGSASVRIPEFLNVDIRRVDGVDIVGHAGHLPEIGEGSVEVLLAKSVLEHIFLAHHLPVLREWKRVLSDEGVIICLGIPDFQGMARLYLEGARGMIGPRFDLYNVYRYSHGDPEQVCPEEWREWRPDLEPDSAPPGWLPQLHKSLFDANYLQQLIDRAGLNATLFRYGYPGEPHAVGLGFLARRGERVGAGGVEETLRRVPGIGRWMDMNTLVPLLPTKAESEQLLGYADALSTHRSRLGVTLRQRARQLLRSFRSVRTRLMRGLA